MVLVIDYKLSTISYTLYSTLPRRNRYTYIMLVKKREKVKILYLYLIRFFFMIIIISTLKNGPRYYYNIILLS